MRTPEQKQEARYQARRCVAEMAHRRARMRLTETPGWNVLAKRRARAELDRAADAIILLERDRT